LVRAFRGSAPFQKHSKMPHWMCRSPACLASLPLLLAPSHANTCVGSSCVVLEKDNILMQFNHAGMLHHHKSIPQRCSSVKKTDASDAWSKGTCGGRLSWMTSRSGGHMRQHDALAKLALDYTACGACWPYEKFKDSEDTSVSPKRGIAIENSKLSSKALASLAGAVSWGYGWGSSTGGIPDVDAWDSCGIQWIPMIHGAGSIAPAEARGIAKSRRALLGFNEPNFPEQANLSPQHAASLWGRVEKLAAAAGIKTLVSPAMNFAHIDPIKWLKEFFHACRGCQVDAIAFHSYTCYGKWLRDHIDLYKQFSKPLWLTEFACSDPAAPERLSVEGQKAYMREAIPLLERDPDIHMYSWFSYFGDEWAYPIVSGRNGDAGLVHANGQLSELGNFYASFAADQPRARQPLPSTPITTCHTAKPGEECYNHVIWAKNQGIKSSPDKYPGLTTSSSFEDFQNSLHSIGFGGCRQPCTITVAERELQSTPSEPSPSPSCHTAVAGEACYKDVMWAKNTGIHQHPGWYPGLTPSSGFEEFQESLHSSGSNKVCPKPCADAPCHTAVSGESCYKDVIWAKDTGIHEHPEWYPGLNTSSGFKQFQQHLHASDSKKCPKPCAI